MLAKQYSDANMLFPVAMGLHLWAHGTPRSVIEILASVELSASYDTIIRSQKRLSHASIEASKSASHDHPHAFGFDNIECSSSIHIEQRPDAPPKVICGTTSTMYTLRNCTRVDFEIKSFSTCPNRHYRLSMDDIDPAMNRGQQNRLRSQFIADIVSVLMDSAEFEKYKQKKELPQHVAVQLWDDLKPTPVFPLRTTEIPPKSRDGTRQVLHDMLSQVGTPKEEVEAFAQLVIADQASCSLIRGTQAARLGDVDAYEDLSTWKVIPGLFHLQLNLNWLLLRTHRGDVKVPGSLAYYINLLHQTRLQCPKPDYFTLKRLLGYVFIGQIHYCWLKISKFSDLKAFYNSRPSPRLIAELAAKILDTFASEIHLPPKKDEHAHNKYARATFFLRDMLIAQELDHGISDGDHGRVEDLYGYLAMMMQGGGASRYCAEILHLVRNLHVWPAPFAYVCSFYSV